MLTIDASHAEFVLSDEGSLLREDVLCWFDWYKDHEFFKNHALEVNGDPANFIVLKLNKLFVLFPEFRSLLDYRVIKRPELRNYKSTQFKRSSELYINCEKIGPRFRIQHGQNTYVFARQIGSDFWVNHNVTIGSNRGLPTIGDRVTVRTGSVVVGPITIGDDVNINANAVVSEDVPSGYVAYAPRTVVRPRKDRF